MRIRARIGGLCLCVALLALALGVSSAQANRALLSEEVVRAKETPDKQIEGACGVAVNSLEEIVVSDYYHRVVDVFFSGGNYKSQILTGTPPGGPCGLAVSAAGALYANYYHQSVVRLEPSFAILEEGNSTGVAVDVSGNVYVNDRTYVAVYQPSGLPVLSEGQPLKIGLGNVDPLQDAYGLAVFAGKVYVADASDQTIKVYEPAVGPDDPSAVIAGPPGGFNFLADAALAVDPTNGHLLVTDNLQPGFEHPQAAIDEFDASGAFLSQLKHTVIDAEPPGLALSGSGILYATSGNTEEATVLRFGQYSASGPEEAAGPSGEEDSPQGTPAVAPAAAVEAAPAPAAQSTSTAKKPHKKKHRRHHQRKKGAK